MRLFHTILFGLIASLISQCAKVTSPTGGEKDTTPPTLLRSNPANRQLNFNKNEIELVFDEAIQINNPREQLIITPSIGKKFELAARKNKAVLKLNADLQENTTYTIAFRESIQDLTERNPAVNLKLAFSTGDYIDSMAIEGYIYDLQKGAPVKNFVVAAVPYSDTLNIFKHPAQYITLCNDKGIFSLENLKAGQYLLYSFNDINKNLIVDSRTEAYGFLAQPLQLDSSIIDLQLPTVRLDARELKLVSARPIGRYFNLRTTKGIAEYQLASESDKRGVHSILEEPALIKVYNTFPNTDSLLIRFQAKDSIDNQIDTLLYLKFETRSLITDKFSLKIDYCDFYENRTTLKSAITFNKPVWKTNYDSIFIRLDSVNIVRFDSADFTWNHNRTILNVDKRLPKETEFTAPSGSRAAAARGQSPPRQVPASTDTKPELPLNQFILQKTAFISIESDTSNLITSSIRTLTPENSGVILVEVKTEKKVVVELLNRSGSLVASTHQHITRFDNLPPADYQVRAVIDLNGNGRWDAGNFYNKTEPEPIIFYQNDKGATTLSLKANWELGPLLITPEQNVGN